MLTQTTKKDGLYIHPHRPNRKRIRYFVKYYPLLVGILISLVVFISLILVDVKLTFLILAGYWTYFGLRSYLRKNNKLGEIYQLSSIQLLRVITLVLAITALLFYIYTHTNYLSKVQDDFLWLLYLPAISAISQHGERKDYLLIVTLVISCLFLVNPAISTATSILTIETFLSALSLGFFTKSIWIVLISSTSYILLRYTSDAVANISLIIDVQNRMRQIEGKLLSSKTSLSEINSLEKAVELIKNDLYYDHVNVFKLDQYDENLICIAAACEEGKKLAQNSFRVKIGEKSIISHVIQHKTLYLSNNVNSDSNYLFHDAFPKTQSELVVPIIVRNRLFGVLDIQVHQTNYFLDQDIQAIQILANHLGWVIDNSEQFEHINWINRVVETIASPMFTQADLDETLQGIAKSAAEELAADQVLLYSYDANSNEKLFGPIYAGDLLFPELMDATTFDQDNVVFRIIDSDEDIITNTNLDQVRLKTHRIFKPSPTHKLTGKPTFIEREKIKSNVIIQLKHNGQCVGVLFLNFRKARNFSSWDEKRYLSFASLAALAIQKMQLQQDAIQKGKSELINLNHTLIGSAIGLFRILKTIKVKLWNLNKKMLQENLSLAMNAGEGLYNEIRWVERMLKDEVFDDLMVEIEKQVKLTQQVFKVKIHTHWSGNYSQIHNSLAKELYIVMREALTNSVRHGKSKNVTIKSQITKNRIKIFIIDNGIGFNPKLVKRENGLFIMKYLTAKANGSFKLTSMKGKGTKISIQVPLQ